MIFSSLSFDYNWLSAKQMLVAKGSNQDRQILIKTLNKLYEGQQTLLFSQGRAALAIAVGLTRSQYVGVNSFNPYVVEQAIKKAKAIPVFLDINRAVNNYQFGLEELKEAHRQQPKMKAIIVGNCFGLKIKIKPIERYCQQNNIIIIENLAHGFNTSYTDGRQVGTVGQLVMVSFGRRKQIDVVNGGALTIRDPKLVPKELPLGNPTFACRWSNRLYPASIVFTRALIGHDRTVGRIIYRFSRWSGLIQPVYGNPIKINHQLGADRAALINNQMVESLQTRQTKAEQTIKAYNINDSISPQPALVLPVMAQSNWHKRIILKKLKKEGVCLDKNWYDSQIYPKRFANVSTYLSGSCPRSEKANRRIMNLPINGVINQHKAKKVGAIINHYNQYRIKTPTDRQQWEEYIKQLSVANLSLAWEFGQAADKNGQLVMRRIINDGQTKVGLFQAVLQRSFLGNHLEINGGPVWIQDPNYNTVFDLMVEFLLDIGRKLKISSVRFQPFLLSNQKLKTQNIKSWSQTEPSQHCRPQNNQDQSDQNITCEH